ncbi:Arm DNA-binding domain-containing protein [Sphingobium sp. EM0848]|uniref:Arm DNA-binding domain-containing protein n=1 Tax=Sphingobium sp. EM0848 TaxID=2743473 RepID=UPI00159C9385|nr:Arm DNA-binding domain-containing protein [Sphingobium sp. EM0848]
MPSGTKIDFEAIDILSIPLPARGEKLLYDARAKGLALRLRASGARTWVAVERTAARTVRTTLGDARHLPLEAARRLLSAGPQDRSTVANDALFGPDATMAEAFPRFLASSLQARRDAGSPAQSAT